MTIPRFRHPCRRPPGRRVLHLTGPGASGGVRTIYRPPVPWRRRPSAP